MKNKKIFLIFLLPILIVSCATQSKNKKIIAGALLGGLVAQTTTPSNVENKTLWVSGGVSAGALLGWSIATMETQENPEDKLHREEQELKRKIEFIQKVKQNDTQLKFENIQKWNPVEETDSGKKLQFIEKKYQEDSP